MRIIFDLRKVGLGDNGGSSTIVKSANTLHDFGHDVYVIDSMRNQHTWTPLKAKHIIIKNPLQIPDADAIIATGYKSVGSTVSAPERCGLKMHWIRAWETWQMSEDQIVKKVLKQPTIKLVNGVCLANQLKKYGEDCYIIRPGYDFDMIYPMNLRNHNKIILGGLFRAGIHGQRKRTEWVLKAASIIKQENPKIQLHMFGSEPNPNLNVIDKYLRKPTMKQKCKFYNGINIWLAPTKSEGLHMPPAEAMMTKCPVVGTVAPLSGIQDYLFDGHTGIMTNDDFDSFLKGIRILINDKQARIDYGEVARETILSLGDRKQNMEAFVKLIGELK